MLAHLLPERTVEQNAAARCSIVRSCWFAKVSRNLPATVFILFRFIVYCALMHRNRSLFLIILVESSDSENIHKSNECLSSKTLAIRSEPFGWI